MSANTVEDQNLNVTTEKHPTNNCTDSEDLFAEYDGIKDDHDSNMDQSNEMVKANGEIRTIMNNSFGGLEENQYSRGSELFQLNSNLKLPPVTLGSGAYRHKAKVFVKWPLVKKDETFVVPL